MTKEELLSYIDRVSGDPKYQTIEVNGQIIRRGYSQSEKSWANIQKLDIVWKDKSVMEVGPFNGYFMLQLEKAGSKEVVGYERNAPAIDIAAKVFEINGLSKCRLESVELGKETNIRRKFDIVVALNVLHHIMNEHGIDDFRILMKSIFENCDEFLVEQNQPELNIVHEVALEDGFIAHEQIQSHRFGRTIVHFRRK